MTIKYPINNFLHEIFPTEDRTIDSVKKAISKHHAQGVVNPTIEEKDNQLIVSIDSASAEIENKKFLKLITLCDQKKFQEASILVTQLISENPKISEYHRILGQIQSESGDQESAIDTLIDSLRWDPYNEWALLMMGNIQAKYKKDIDTALHYFNQALSCNSKDAISMTSIGFLLLEKNRLEEAIEFCNKALEINNTFPNTHLTLAFIAEKRKNHKDQFSHAINALKNSKEKDQVYQAAIRTAHEAAAEIITWPENVRIINNYQAYLEKSTDKPIKMATNENLQVSAKISVAEYHKKDHHLIEYKPNFTAVEHLVMHELVHLDFILQARKDEVNELFTSNQTHDKVFDKIMLPAEKTLRKRGLPEQNISGFLNAIKNGLRSQLYNTPIDLFIEDKLYNEFPDLRPFQFISLYQLNQIGIQAVNSDKVTDITPEIVVRATRILNLVNALHFKDIFGLNLIDEFNAPNHELIQAKKFYDEYQEYRNDRQPGEEYEIIENWSKDLGLDNIFTLRKE